jgi:large subunit ribosomal protein L32
MTIPKKRHSATRRDKRRASWKIENPVQTIDCPQCTEPMRPHRVCPKCGYYKGREVVTVS